MTDNSQQTVEMIPIEQIEVVNPRVRNVKVFREIVENISKIGLKRPITVARQAGATEVKYDLVCGHQAGSKLIARSNRLIFPHS